MPSISSFVMRHALTAAVGVAVLGTHMCVFANAPLPPADVSAFVHHRQACDTWRNATGSDAISQLRIADGICRKCVGMDARLSALRQRYANQSGIAQSLSTYQSNIEVLTVPKAIERCLPIHYQLIRHNKSHPAHTAPAAPN